MMWFILFVVYVLVQSHRQRTFYKQLADHNREAILLCADTMEHCADVIDKLCDDDGADDTRVRAGAKARDAAERVRFTSTPITRTGQVIPLRPGKAG